MFTGNHYFRSKDNLFRLYKYFALVRYYITLIDYTIYDLSYSRYIETTGHEKDSRILERTKYIEFHFLHSALVKIYRFIYKMNKFNPVQFIISISLPVTTIER